MAKLRAVADVVAFNASAVLDFQDAGALPTSSGPSKAIPTSSRRTSSRRAAASAHLHGEGLAGAPAAADDPPRRAFHHPLRLGHPVGDGADVQRRRVDRIAGGGQPARQPVGDGRAAVPAFRGGAGAGLRPATAVAMRLQRSMSGAITALTETARQVSESATLPCVPTAAPATRSAKRRRLQHHARRATAADQPSPPTGNASRRPSTRTAELRLADAAETRQPGQSQFWPT